MRVLFCAAALAVMLCSQALAAFDLQITEIWPGNSVGDNLSEDWFEVTNFGDTPWVEANDGNLYFDDDSYDATTADLLFGVSSIAPGESVVFVDGNAASSGINTFQWTDLMGRRSKPASASWVLRGSGTFSRWRCCRPVDF